MSVATREATPPVLYGVPWELYTRLRNLRGTRHLRMTYHDGTLVIMSPEYVHERAAERLGLIVRAVAAAFGIDVAGLRTTTLRQQGDGEDRGEGKEPDAAFYFGEHEAQMRGKDRIDLTVDPPPDLAIEVDHKSDSRLALPAYAGLRVPEVWRFTTRTRTLWFGRLDVEAGQYVAIPRSLALPMLTPERVLQALDACAGRSETAWDLWLRTDWAPGLAG